MDHPAPVSTCSIGSTHSSSYRVDLCHDNALFSFVPFFIVPDAKGTLIIRGVRGYADTRKTHLSLKLIIRGKKISLKLIIRGRSIYNENNILGW